MAHSPHSRKVHIDLRAIRVIIFQRQRQICLGGNRCIALEQPRIDAEIVRYLRSAVSFRIFHQVIERRIHLETVIDRMSLSISFAQIFCIRIRVGRILFFQNICQRRIKMRPISISIAKQGIFSLSRIQLIEGCDSLGSRLNCICKGRQILDRGGIGRSVICHPCAVGIQGIDVILRRLVDAGDGNSRS